MNIGDAVPLSSLGYPDGMPVLSLAASDVAIVYSITMTIDGIETVLEAPNGLYLSVLRDG